MMSLINAVQIISAILLVVFIIAQQRGSGLGSIAGSGGGNQVFTSRRGVEKVMFNITIVLIAIFVISSLLAFLL